MKQKFFTLLALFACVLTASAQGFTVKDVEMVPGTNQYKIDLDLAVNAEFIGCSFSINLPAGVTPVMTTATLPTDVEGQAATEQQVVKCDLSSEFVAAGTYVFSHKDGDVYKFVVLPTTGPANLKAGTVMSVYVQGPGDVTFPTEPVTTGEGKNYPVAKAGSASDVVFAANVSSTIVDVPLANPIPVNFLTYRLGDANADGKIDTKDASLVVTKFLGRPIPDETKLVEIAADIAGSSDGKPDGKIDTKDASKMVNVFLGN